MAAAVLSMPPAGPSLAQVPGDLLRGCGNWVFHPDLVIEEGPEPAVELACADSLGFIVVCVLGDFIAGLRYYGPPSSLGEDAGYQQFRFTAGERSIDMYLRFEGLDAAWATYTEFEHPLFSAIREEAGPIRVTHVASGESASLPLRGSARAFAALRTACEAL